MVINTASIYLIYIGNGIAINRIVPNVKFHNMNNNIQNRRINNILIATLNVSRAYQKSDINFHLERFNGINEFTNDITKLNKGLLNPLNFVFQCLLYRLCSKEIDILFES